jgi:hypothetical protein
LTENHSVGLNINGDSGRKNTTFTVCVCNTFHATIFNETLLLSYLPTLLHFQLLLHNPVETPKIADFGSLIAPGREYRVEISPIINNATRSLSNVKEAARQCAYSAERYLRFYRTYTQEHCNLECEANFTFDVCSCVPFYLPSTCAQMVYSSFFPFFRFVFLPVLYLSAFLKFPFYIFLS